MLPAIYAHRLGRDYGPDSSRTALARTLERPVEGLETDVCLTSDGDLVLLHDPLLELNTTLSGWVHERRAAEICAGRLRGRDGRITEERPLVLDELLEAAPSSLALQLEVKAYADAALAARTAGAICERLRDHPGRERVEITSFWPAACRVGAELGFRARLIVIAAYEAAALAAWSRRIGLHGIGVEPFLLSSPLVATLRAAGLSVTSGTVNRAELFEPLLHLGLDGVTSDCPHELRGSFIDADPLELAA
jgi:glycerophosphoryl diester phosphodiesterase